MTRAQEVGRVVGVLGTVKLVLDGLCDSTAPSTGPDVLAAVEFQHLMRMADQIDRLMANVPPGDESGPAPMGPGSTSSCVQSSG